MKIKKGFKAVLTLSLCFIMAAALISCGGKTTIESLSISPTNINVVVGTPLQFEAAGSESNGVITNVNTQVNWNSSNPSAATVTSSGLVTAVGPGTTTISISSSGSISASAALQVSPIPTPVQCPVGNNPSGIAIDSNGNIWVTNYTDSTVTELCGSNTANCPAGITTGQQIGLAHPVGGTNPSGIAIDGYGNLWIANYGSSNVTELNSSGTLIGGPFTADVGVNPTSIVIDATGLIWVTNQGSNFVTLLNSSGGAVAEYTLPVGITAPNGMAVGGVNLVWVTWVAGTGTASAPGTAVTGIAASGSLYGPFGVSQSGKPVQYQPSSVAIDQNNFVWVTNQLSNSVSELNTTGTVLGVFPPSGTISLNGPDAIAIDTAGSKWVANYGTTAAPGNTLVQLSPTDGAAINSFTVQNNPSAVVVDASNNVWVANYGSNSVTFLKSIASGPQFRVYINGPVWP